MALSIEILRSGQEIKEFFISN